MNLTPQQTADVATRKAHEAQHDRWWQIYKALNQPSTGHIADAWTNFLRDAGRVRRRLWASVNPDTCEVSPAQPCEECDTCEIRRMEQDHLRMQGKVDDTSRLDLRAGLEWHARRLRKLEAGRAG